jgi:hypothetical protein
MWHNPKYRLKDGSILRAAIDRLRFNLESDFRRKDLDDLERQVVDMLDGFVRLMADGCCDKCRDKVLENVGEEISHYRCDLCDRAATEWVGPGKVCDVHSKDIPMLAQVFDNLKKGIDKLESKNH